MKTKICSHCKKELPITEFGKNKQSKKDGLYCYCKSCSREASKKSCAKIRNTPEGRQRRNEANRISHAKTRSTPEGRAKANEANRISQAKTRSTPEGRAKANEANNRLYATNPERRFKCKARAYERKRKYGDTLLAPDIIDELSVQHHVNDKEIIIVPRDIHVMYPTYPKEVHRFMVNQVVKQIYNIKIKENDIKWIKKK